MFKNNAYLCKVWRRVSFPRLARIWPLLRKITKRFFFNLYKAVKSDFKVFVFKICKFRLELIRLICKMATMKTNTNLFSIFHQFFLFFICSQIVVIVYKRKVYCFSRFIVKFKPRNCKISII